MKSRTLLLVGLSVLVSQAVQAGNLADDFYEEAMNLHGKAGGNELFKLYASSAELGNPYAQYNLAVMYANGQSVEVNYRKAAHWFIQSANQGCAAAQYQLGELYYFGLGGLPLNKARAAVLFRQAAEQGDPDAQIAYGIMLATRSESPQDTEKALSLIAQAKYNGHPSASYFHQLLQNSENGSLTAAQMDEFWREQDDYWAQVAGRYDVRETSHLAGNRPSSPDDNRSGSSSAAIQ